jgi:hypothetical protein
MRLTKSLLSLFAALALATGSAFAGGYSMSSQSVEAGGPDLFDGDTLASEQFNERYPMNGSESLAGLDQPGTESYAESDMIYIYPMQVTEYYLLVPSVDSEMPLG